MDVHCRGWGGGASRGLCAVACHNAKWTSTVGLMYGVFLTLSRFECIILIFYMSVPLAGPPPSSPRGGFEKQPLLGLRVDFESSSYVRTTQQDSEYGKAVPVFLYPKIHNPPPGIEKWIFVPGMVGNICEKIRTQRRTIIISAKRYLNIFRRSRFKHTLAS